MLASQFYLIIGLVTGGLFTSGVGFGVFRALTRDARARKRLFGEYAPPKARSLPEQVETELQGLREDLARILELEDFRLAEKVGKVISLSQELFTKLKQRGDKHQLNMAAVGYGDLLAKLNRALSDDYYFDMRKNPAMWTRVTERLTMIHSVAEAISEELLTAIRDFNSHADVHYDVDLESILRRAGASAMLKDLM